MEEKNLAFWNLIMKKILEEEKELYDKDQQGNKSHKRSRYDGAHPPCEENRNEYFRAPEDCFQGSCLFEKNSVRVYTPEERMVLSSEAIGYLQKLLSSGIIDIEVHEEIVEKMKWFSESLVGVDEVKIVGSMVLAEHGYKNWYRNLLHLFDEIPHKERLQ
jgi:hypothetical protein